MTTKQAAEIIKAHVNARDNKSASEGLNSTDYTLRRIGDTVSAADEDLADDVLAGRGAGSAAASRRLIRVAKAVANACGTGQKDGKITKHTYQITIGETGNERGHVATSSHVSDTAAIRAARRLCAQYKVDGWWRVECAGATVARGGRAN